MKKINLTKLYDRFTPEERLRLMIESLARGDDEDTGRLIDSCPVKDYIQKDNAFVVPVKAAHDLIQSVCRYLDYARVRLEMIQSFQLVITILLESWFEPKTEGEEGCLEETRKIFGWLSEVLENDLRRPTIIKLKVTLEGLAHFCESTFSLNSGTALKAFAKPYWEWLEGLQDEIAMAEAPPADVADYEKALIKEWNLRIGVSA
jgi:hypothetical protein